MSARVPAPSGSDPPFDVERRAAKGGVVVAAAQVTRGAIEAAGLLVLSRTLLPSDFGLVDMIIAVTGIIDQLKDFGLGTALIQRPRIEHRQVNTLFWISVAIGAGLTLLTAAIAPLIAIGYDQPALRNLTFALSLSTVLGSISLQQQALLRRELRFGALSLIDVISTGLGTASAVFAALAAWGAWALVLRQLVRLASQAVLTWTWSSWRPGLPRRGAEVGELLRFGGHLSGFQVLNYLERNFDNVLIGRFAGAQALGLYAKAYELMRLPLTAVNAPIATVAVPTLSRLADAPDRYRSAYCAVTRLLLVVTVPLGALMLLSAEAFIPLLLGAHWAECVPIFQWLALALLIKPLLFTTSWLFISQGRSAEIWRWGVVGSSLALVSFLIGLPWGALGVAISFTLVDLGLRAPILLWWVGRTGPVSTTDMLSCLGPAWSGTAALGLTYWSVATLAGPLSPSAELALCAPMSLLAAAVTVWLIPASRRSLQTAHSYLRAAPPASRTADSSN